MAAAESEETKGWRGFLKHPLVVGVITATLTIVFGPILLPWLNPEPVQADCAVPALTGLQELEAFGMLRDMSLKAVKLHVFNSNADPGLVVAQIPPARQLLKQCNGTVQLSISSTQQLNGELEEIPPGATPRDISNNGSPWLTFWIAVLAIGLMYFAISDYFH